MLFDDKYFIGHKIKSFRKKRGLTQAELAEMVDLSEKHISKIEAGIHLPSISAFLKMIKILNINLDEFGLSINENEDDKRKEFIELIYRLSNDELQIILPVVKCLQENLHKNKLI